MVLNVRNSIPVLMLCGAIATGPISAGNDQDESAHGSAHSHGHEAGRQSHGAHVHGRADLNLVLDGRRAYIELTSPAANIVGFEHPPATPDDHAAVGRAAAKLEQGDDLFRFNVEAGCRMQHAEVNPGWGRPDSHGGQQHADFDAAYEFECTAPGRLEQLKVGIFEAFPATSRLQVQFVVGDRQGGTSLTASEPVLAF